MFIIHENAYVSGLKVWTNALHKIGFEILLLAAEYFVVYWLACQTCSEKNWRLEEGKKWINLQCGIGMQDTAIL